MLSFIILGPYTLLYDLLSGIDVLLSDDGIFLSESHYLFSLIEDLQFDTIYHEHLRYYSATFLIYALKKFNLKVFKIESIKSHGGSIRVWAARSGKFKIDESVKNYLELESQYDLPKVLNKFEKSIENNDLQALQLLIARASQLRAGWDMQAGDEN